MSKQVHLKSLGKETTGLFPKLVFDEATKTLKIYYEKSADGKIKLYETAVLTETVIS